MFQENLSRAVSVLALLAVVSSAPASDKKETDYPVIKLAAQAKTTSTASNCRLMPDALDMVEGNAALLWTRSVMACRAVRYKWTEVQNKWYDRDATPLDKLPLKEVKAVLAAHANALRLADQAALRTYCDWGKQPPTLQTLATDLEIDDIQGLREIARLLRLRTRMELAERRFDDAQRSLQTGLAMTRDLGGKRLVIEDLVAIAIAAITFSGVEEWIAIPGSPNLYWALTELPRPLVNMRNSLRNELSIIYRSFPELRELKTKQKLSAEAQLMVGKLYKSLNQVGFPSVAQPWMAKMGSTALALKYYPVAKKGLIASGRTTKEVEAMPSLQVVALYYLEQFDQMREEIMQWLSVPAWQGQKGLEKIQAKYKQRAEEDGNILNILTSLQAPAVVKVSQAQVRLGRQVAGLRGAEALRYHVAVTGKVPTKWSDVTEVPEPTDPLTGKGFDAWYKFDGTKGVLSVPPRPGMPPSLGRSYQIVEKES